LPHVLDHANNIDPIPIRFNFSNVNAFPDWIFVRPENDGDQGAGGEDKLRIRIWSDSNGLIYDNKRETPEITAPITGGGSIVRR
jgi:hypothetical protein